MKDARASSLLTSGDVKRWHSALIVGALLQGAGVWLSPSAWPTPFVPERDDVVLETIPARLNVATLELRTLRARLAEEPTNDALAVELARRYIAIGRAELDPRYFGYAQAALDPWLESETPASDVRVLGAILKQQQHDFDGALKDFDAVLREDPGNAQAWLSSAMVLQVQGKQRDAMAHCTTLGMLPGSSFVGTVCLAKSLGVSGKSETADRLLEQVLESARDSPAPERQWASTIRAEIAARRGNDVEAERYFQQALSLGARDSYLLAVFADFLLDVGQPERVGALLAEHTRVDRLLLTLAIAEKHLGRAVDARTTSLGARFAASRARGDNVHLGDEARFSLHLLNNPRAALDLALANWRVQREPRDARIVLEAALAANDAGAARGVLEELRQSSLEDVRLAELAAQLERLE